MPELNPHTAKCPNLTLQTASSLAGSISCWFASPFSDTARGNMLRGHHICRLINQLTAVLQQLAASPSSSAAAAVAPGDDSVTVDAACRLALFFPQGDLLTLTQVALSCVQPDSHPDSSIEGYRLSQVAKVGLHLAEALIKIWTEQKGGDVAVEGGHRNAGRKGDERDQGTGAVWVDVAKGLLGTALRCGRAQGSGPEIGPDALLLKMLRSSPASFDG